MKTLYAIGNLCTTLGQILMGVVGIAISIGVLALVLALIF